MGNEQRREAKGHIMPLMQAGRPCHEVPACMSTIICLLASGDHFAFIVPSSHVSRLRTILGTMHLLWESQRQPGSRFPLSMASWEAVVQSCSTPCLTHRWTSHDRGELPGENGDKHERSQCITQRAE